MSVPHRNAISIRPVGAPSARRVGITATGRIQWWRSNAQLRGHLTDAEVRVAERWADARFPRGHKMVVKQIPLYPHLVGDLDCNRELLERLERVGKRLERVVEVRSGRRTMDEQRALYEQNMDPRTGLPKPGRPLTAKPNAQAPHTRGVAADCGIRGINIGNYPGARKALKAEGLCLNVASESWHVQIAGNGVEWRNPPIP